MEKHEHYGHRKRLRHRVMTDGMDNFLDYQVLEYALSFVIPYKDTNPIAHRLIDRFGSLAGVFEAEVEDLAKIDGMGEASAHYIASFLKIYNCYQKDKNRNVDYISREYDAYLYVKKLLENKKKEEMYIICLAPNNKIVKTEKLSVGSNNQAQVAMRVITDIISRNKVNDIIIAHNHPSGNANPSEEDDSFTKTLVTALSFNATKLIDHIIVGENTYYSYWSSGKITEYEAIAQPLLGNKTVVRNYPKYEVRDD